MNNGYLIDANILCAYANADDIHHHRAVQLLQHFIYLKEPIYLSDYVFDEVMGVITRKVHKKAALVFGEFLLRSELFVLQTTETVFLKAWDIFQEKNSFSFTDCVLLALHQLFDIERIITFDKEFQRVKDITVISE